MAPEEDLLCLLDYRGSSLGSFCEYFTPPPLFSHVVRKRDAREPTVLYIVYIYAGVGRKRRPREEGDHHPTRLEERHLVSAHLGLGPSQSVAVEGDGSLEVAHAEREEAHPRFHCSQSPLLASRFYTLLSLMDATRMPEPHLPESGSTEGPTRKDLLRIYELTKTIAVVGASANGHKAAH